MSGFVVCAPMASWYRWITQLKSTVYFLRSEMDKAKTERRLASKGLSGVGSVLHNCTPRLTQHHTS